MPNIANNYVSLSNVYEEKYSIIFKARISKSGNVDTRSWVVVIIPLLLILITLTSLGCIDAPPGQPAHDNQWDPDNSSLPEAPDRARAYAVSETEIFIGWRDQSGNETGFNIFEKTHGELGMRLVATTEADEQSVNLKDRRAMTDYSYNIESYNGSGTSYQVPILVSTKNAPPNSPDSMSFSNITNSSINIEWHDNSSIEDYCQLEEAIGSPVNFYQKIIVPMDCTMAVVDSLASNTLFWYRVIAGNSNGKSNYSDPKSVKTNGN